VFLSEKCTRMRLQTGFRPDSLRSGACLYGDPRISSWIKVRYKGEWDGKGIGEWKEGARKEGQ